MANDRMFLVCNDCGEGVFVAKTLAGGWYAVDPEGAHAKMCEFMTQHGQVCHDGAFAVP